MFVGLDPAGFSNIHSTSGHPSGLFLLANGTGMLLFNIKRSQVGVTFLATPAEELLMETTLNCLSPPSCNSPADGVLPGEAEPE